MTEANLEGWINHTLAVGAEVLFIGDVSLYNISRQCALWLMSGGLHISVVVAVSMTRCCLTLETISLTW